MYTVSPFREKRKAEYYDEVIRLHHEEHLRPCVIAERLSLKRSTVSFWIRTFAEQTAIESMKQDLQIASDSLPTEVQELQKEVLELRKRLIQEKLRADAYDEMINVAEGKFKINIRKKAGAKQ
ncbi:MAG: transposase [Bacteroidales bacterium]|nr:transposase [Bacteroidales bacterium]